jgi:lysophospholipase L1-like esterase
MILILIAAYATAAPAVSGKPARDAAASSDAALAAATGVTFPGQWAPPPVDVKYPAFPKGCLTRYVDAAIERASCLEFIAKDWSRLARYAAANAALPAPARNERRVVFFGDSITDNWSKPEYGGFFPGKRYVNRGVGGQTTAQMLGRFRPDVSALQPRAVVILAGTNDLAGNSGPTTPEVIEGNLITLAELARSHGIRTVLASLLPVCDCKQSAEGKPIIRTVDRPPQAIVGLNRRLAEYARKNGFGFVDYYQALADPSGAFKADYTYDGLHPNAAGYAVMAPLAETAIAAALGR